MEFLTFAEAAEAAGISVKTVRRHVAKGKLEMVSTSSGPRIPSAALAPYLATQDIAKDVPRTPPGQVDHSKDAESSVPLAAHLALIELSGHLAGQLDQERRRADMAEKARLALEAQLGQYQRVLSENAESLAEERAKRMEAEAKSARPTPTLWGRLRRLVRSDKSQTA